MTALELCLNSSAGDPQPVSEPQFSAADEPIDGPSAHSTLVDADLIADLDVILPAGPALPLDAFGRPAVHGIAVLWRAPYGTPVLDPPPGDQ